MVRLGAASLSEDAFSILSVRVSSAESDHFDQTLIACYCCLADVHPSRYTHETLNTNVTVSAALSTTFLYRFTILRSEITRYYRVQYSTVVDYRFIVLVTNSLRLTVRAAAAACWPHAFCILKPYCTVACQLNDIQITVINGIHQLQSITVYYVTV